MLDTSNPPFWKWFVGGRPNACYNCVDRHLAANANKAAFLWVPEPEADATLAITYQELYGRVNEFAALLRDWGGVHTADRVTFHLPMVPELLVWRRRPGQYAFASPMVQPFGPETLARGAALGLVSLVRAQSLTLHSELVQLSRTMSDLPRQWSVKRGGRAWLRCTGCLEVSRMRSSCVRTRPSPYAPRPSPAWSRLCSPIAPRSRSR